MWNVDIHWHYLKIFVWDWKILNEWCLIDTTGIELNQRDGFQEWRFLMDECISATSADVSSSVTALYRIVLRILQRWLSSWSFLRGRFRGEGVYREGKTFHLLMSNPYRQLMEALAQLNEDLLFKLQIHHIILFLKQLLYVPYMSNVWS